MCPPSRGPQPGGNEDVDVSIWTWVAFTALVLLLLIIDLVIFQRKPHAISLKEASWLSAFWISLALLFGIGVYYYYGKTAGLEYFTGYLIEESLSVDNMFVFVLIFSYFQVPPAYQHRVLFWGILGAMIMRGIMIGAGVYLIQRFDWIIYIFGAFLVVTAIRMATQEEHDIEPESNPVIRLIRRFVPITASYHGHHFFVRERTDNGATKLVATPLFVVLMMVETTDLIFALDSIPAIFGITQEAFIVYTSNIFAVLGLRALYFLLAGVVDKFDFLQIGLGVVLGFVGVKMLISGFYHIPIGISLGIVGLVLGLSILASIFFDRE